MNTYRQLMRLLFAHLRNQWMGALALFLVLAGGTAYALGQNSVGTKQLKPQAVRTGDLAEGAVTSPKVRDGSLLRQDFAADQLPGATSVVVRQGGPATAGTNGSGPGCVDGVPGGSKGFRDGSNTLISCGGGAGGNGSSTANCAPGEVATGGGYAFQTGKRHALVADSRPEPAGVGQTPTGWRIEVETLTFDSSNSTPVTPYVICVSP